MRWLITGGCGFLGTALVARLVAEGGHSLRVLDNTTSGSRQRLAAIAGYRETPAHDTRPLSDDGESGGVELIDGDVRDMALCLRASEGAETIVHLAAAPGIDASLLEPRFDSETNIGGTLNMLEAARHCDATQFIFASSHAAENLGGAETAASYAVRPTTPYGAAKLAGEAYCFAYARSFGVATTALRFGTLYGPGDTAGPIGRLIRDILKGRRIDLAADAAIGGDFLHIDDATAAILATANGAAGPDEEAIGPVSRSGAFRVSSGEEISIVEILDLLNRLLSHAGYPPAQCPAEPLGDTNADLPTVIPGRSNLPDLPGWQPTNDFGTGIGRTVRWFLDQADRRSVAA